jgi:hypothetical protein
VPEITKNQSCSEISSNHAFLLNRCYEFRGSNPEPERKLLFNEAPIELRDFGFDHQKTITGLKLTFDKAPKGSFYLDRKTLLRSKK